MDKYTINLERTLKAVRMEKVDKIPFSYSGSAYMAKSQGVKIADYLADPKLAVETAVRFCQAHPGIDSIHSPAMNVYTLPLLWLSEVKVPGADLPDDELWQMHEKEKMSLDDYQIIIDKGYRKWLLKFLKERIGNPVPPMAKRMLKDGLVARRMKKAGIPIMNGASIGSPIEGFCGGRQMSNFFMDALEEPELVKAACDKAQEDLEKLFILQLKKARPAGAWVGGWRASPQMIGHDMFMEFVWPYIERLVNICIEHGAVPFLHFDSCWDRELETIKTLPAKKCVLMLDGFTDMRRARAVLDDRMCLMGDVPAAMLAFGTADEVYEYCTKLISDVGPDTGLILSSGCDCPINAKDENVDAMIQASLDFI